MHIVPSFPPNDFVVKDMEYSEDIGKVKTLLISTGQGDKKSNILSTLLNIVRTAYKILKIRPDVVHCHFMTSTMGAVLVPIPTVVTIHESYNWYSPIWRALLSITTRRCSTIFVSEYNRDYWRTLLKKDDTVIYHAIDTDEYAPQRFDSKLRAQLLAELKADYLVFSMGANEPRRGLHLALEAASILRERGINIGVVLRGYGGRASYSATLERMVGQLDVPTKILKKRLSDEEMASLFASVDVFVRPTIVESFGLAVLEAQACGTPVVVTDCCSLKEVFGQSSLTFSPKDPIDLADKMELILTDKKLREKHIQLGLKNAEELSWRRKIQSYLQVYSKAIGRS